MTQLLRLSLALLALAGTPAAVAAGPDMMDAGPPGPPAFVKPLFTPQVVMAPHAEIGPRRAHVDAIKQAMNETQRDLVDLQWKLDAATEALDKLLEPDHADEQAVLAKLDEVTTIERQVKRVNFTLLVRIKNQLDPEQQAKLRAVRPPGHGPGGPPPPPPD